MFSIPALLPPPGTRRGLAATAQLALDSAYAERADERLEWPDKLGKALFDHLAYPLWRRLWPERGRVAGLAAVARRAAPLEAALRDADDTMLAARQQDVRAALRRDGLTAAPLAAALALVREHARRTLGQRPYDVQLMGATALLQGRLAEMATGEGKSLTAALAASVAALAGLPVHVVTVNDYLAARDADAFAPLYAALGISVGTVVQGQPPAQRRAAYRADIAYCCNKELAFDYLRDRVALSSGGGRIPMAVAGLAGAAQPALLLRGLHFVLVDEADSVFIDEARTPLILSAEKETADAQEQAERCATALALARQLDEDRDYQRSDVERRVRLHPEGDDRLAGLCLAAGLGDAVWQSARGRRELVEQALVALHHYHLDQHYLVAEGKVVIVDESTGRVMPDRAWEAGLHQMIETKEGCDLSPRRVTLARITYQRLFRRALLLAGMTGTVREVASEMWQVYRLPVVTVPTHRPSKRRVGPPRLLPDSAAKWQAVASRVRELAQGERRPVLIGTRSVEASEQISQVLAEHGLEHALLNARQDAEEAAVVARAGEPGRVTVATNMAGRGTDIHLGDGVAARGGLHVILTECHASARIDRQLFGRGARQGDPGSAEMILAADDELLRTHAGALVQRLLARWPDGPPPWAILTAVRAAQAVASWRDLRQRRATLHQDELLDRLFAFTGTAE
jgi:preprotein translocase subunit SecA